MLGKLNDHSTPKHRGIPTVIAACDPEKTINTQFGEWGYASQGRNYTDYFSLHFAPPIGRNIVPLKRNPTAYPTPTSMEELADDRNALVKESQIPFTTNISDDRWWSAQIVLNYTKSTPLITDDLHNRFVEVFGLEVNAALSKSPCKCSLKMHFIMRYSERAFYFKY